MMKISTIEIRNNVHHGPFTFDQLVNVSELESLNNDIKQIDPVRVKGMCTVDKDELIFTFTIEGKMILPCARTLVDVPYPFSFQATEIFSTSPGLDEEDKEDGVHLLTEELLDLTPYIMENIVLQTPYLVFSDEKTLEEGEGWAFLEEEDHEKGKQNKIDPRLAKLKKLLDKDNGQNED